jgi:hypothetical protein
MVVSAAPEERCAQESVLAATEAASTERVNGRIQGQM